MPVYCSCTCWTPFSSQNGLIKQGLSNLFGCFLGIWSLGFSEFWDGDRNPYHVRDRARFFLKNFFAPKIREMYQNCHWICSIMKIYIICCGPAQMLCFGKILFLRYRQSDCRIFKSTISPEQMDQTV